jgi:hypothetical protein
MRANQAGSKGPATGTAGCRQAPRCHLEAVLGGRLVVGGGCSGSSSLSGSGSSDCSTTLGCLAALVGILALRALLASLLPLLRHALHLLPYGVGDLLLQLPGHALCISLRQPHALPRALGVCKQQQGAAGWTW